VCSSDLEKDDVYRGKKLSSQFLTPIDFQIPPKYPKKSQNRS